MFCACLLQLEMLFVPDFFERWTDTLEMTIFAVNNPLSDWKLDGTSFAV
jgi:hypothetical protein